MNSKYIVHWSNLHIYAHDSDLLDNQKLLWSWKFVIAQYVQELFATQNLSGTLTFNPWLSMDQSQMVLSALALRSK